MGKAPPPQHPDGPYKLPVGNIIDCGPGDGCDIRESQVNLSRRRVGPLFAGASE